MKEKTLGFKAVAEAIALMNVNLDLLEKNRSGDFRLKDIASYVPVVEGLKAGPGQEDCVFALHRDSVRHHYRILSSLTQTVDKKDEPYTETIQGPALMELLYEKDPSFRKFAERFVAELDNARDIVCVEADNKREGVYGPVCVADFALTPGSTANVINQILRRMSLTEKERYYAQTILASKSWGMNTSYVFGWAYMDALADGKTKDEAVSGEIKWLKAIFDAPVKAQENLMNSKGSMPYAGAYMREYKKAMSATVDECLKKDVNYANILSVPAYSIGDIGHHLCQSVYELYRDDLLFEMLKGIVDVVRGTLGKLKGDESPGQILGIATGATAASITYLLESEGFTSADVIDFMNRRYRNFFSKYPLRGVGIEFHNVDFADVIYRGDRILNRDKGVIHGIEIDFSPLKERGLITDYREWAYPNCGPTRLFAALMKVSDHFCYINIEPISMALMTNMIAQDPKVSMSPIRGCKKCAISSVVPDRCGFCERTNAV